MTQKETVLKHLKKHKKITSLDAFNMYGITRLSDVIFRLRKDGYNISSKLESVVTKYGKTQFSEYKLCD